MKKYLKYVLLFICLFMFNFEVQAKDYELKQLISVDSGESVNVNTETFQYTELYFANVNEKDYFYFNVTNLRDSKLPISINLLLFDADKKNIGFVSYCTDKDYSSEFSKYFLSPNQSIAFNINLNSKYFNNDKTLADVYYYAIMDENKHCQIGGYDKYLGLTIEEISSGIVSSNLTEEGVFYQLWFYLKSNFSKILIFYIGFLLISLIIYGFILNLLHRKMYGITSTLAYLPIGNVYITVKMAFGEGFAKIYLLLLFVSIPLLFIGIGFLILVILSILNIVAFVLDIIKLFTKNYNSASISLPKSSNFNHSHQVSNYNNSSQETALSSDNSEQISSGDEIIDLSYNNMSLNDNLNGQNDLTDVNEAGNISLGGINSNSQKNENSNESDGGSDLSKFFK